MSGFDEQLAFDLSAIVQVFGEPTSLSRPELLDYWFVHQRNDGISVTLSISGYERTAAVIVGFAGNDSGGSVRIENCDKVRVLEADRKTMEITSTDPNVRCFLSLDGQSVFTVHAGDDPTG